MKNKILILCILFFAAGCGGKKEKPSDSMSMKDYAQSQNVVEVMELKKCDFQRQLLSNGRLEAVNKSEISFRSTGRIVSVNVSQGQSVSKGQIIAELDKYDAQAALQQAIQQKNQAETRLHNELLGSLGSNYEIGDTINVPEDLLRRLAATSGYTGAVITLESAKNNLENCTLRAPFSGKIAEIKSRQHENPLGVFCTVIDDSSFDVNFNILETELNFVKVGMKVKMSTFNNPDKFVEGAVRAINPMVNDKGQINVLARVNNNGEMIDGMNVKIMVESTVPNMLVVPKSAVVIRDNLEVLFRYSDGKAVWTYVNTLMSNSHSYVVEGNAERGDQINEGDTIIISGNLNLGDMAEVELAK